MTKLLEEDVLGTIFLGRTCLHVPKLILRQYPLLGMADDESPSAKRRKTALIDANDAITFHFLDAKEEPTAITESSRFRPDMCHQFFGDEEVSGQSDFVIAKTPQGV